MTVAIGRDVIDILRSHTAEVGAEESFPLDVVMTDIGIDSLELLAIVSEIEEQFGLSIDDASLEGVTSVQQLIELVVSLAPAE